MEASNSTSIRGSRRGELTPQIVCSLQLEKAQQISRSAKVQMKYLEFDVDEISVGEEEKDCQDSCSSNSSSASCSKNNNDKGRRRRDELLQQFSSLSSLVSGSNEIEDAIKFLNDLQERGNILEKQMKNKSGKIRFSSDASSCGDFREELPEVKARAEEKNVLIKIHCEKHQALLSKLLDQVEMLHLTVVNMCALPFGDHFMDITIIAQMEKKFSLTMNDLKRNLRLALPELR